MAFQLGRAWEFTIIELNLTSQHFFNILDQNWQHLFYFKQNWAMQALYIQQALSFPINSRFFIFDQYTINYNLMLSKYFKPFLLR